MTTATYATRLGKEMQRGRIHIPAGIPDSDLRSYCMAQLENAYNFTSPFGDLFLVIRKERSIMEEEPKFS